MVYLSVHQLPKKDRFSANLDHLEPLEYFFGRHCNSLVDMSWCTIRTRLVYFFSQFILSWCTFSQFILSWCTFFPYKVITDLKVCNLNFNRWSKASVFIRKVMQRSHVLLLSLKLCAELWRRVLSTMLELTNDIMRNTMKIKRGTRP